ncbi:hypothetical protein ACFYM3_22855 [Streptomyces massasporeus]|uniref:Uncharacterized protein n=1 Tax=Streptomyces massasporeus TaxID=67324 RepID=A0ABW6LK53_9ACTN
MGRVTVAPTDLWLTPGTCPRIVPYVPADEESRERLDMLQAMALGRETGPQPLSR